MSKHLIVLAAWVEAETPDDATESIAEGVKGLTIPHSGAIVSLHPKEIGPDLARDLSRLNLHEATRHDAWKKACR